MTTTVRPVRAIKRAAEGVYLRVVNAMSASGDAQAAFRAQTFEHNRPRKAIDQLLTGLPRQSLESILKQI